MVHQKRSPNMLLQQARKKMGLTQSSVADQIRLGDTKTVSRWERGAATPNGVHIRRLCALFEKTPQELGFIEEIDTPLRQAREERGWSQQYVADQIGTHPVNVSRWEREEARPDPLYLQRLYLLYERDTQELSQQDKR